MEEIIQKAKDGGYFYDSDCEYVCNASYVIDPLFWQSLGKACGWEMWSGESGLLGEQEIEYWKYHALIFHEINLTEGFEKAVEYLKSITTPPMAK